MGRLADVDEVLDLFGVSDSDIYARTTIEDAVLSGDVETYTKAEPPKIGKWVEDVAYYDEDGCPCIITRCNQCGEPNPVSNFCPNCGAKMEGSDGND